MIHGRIGLTTHQERRQCFLVHSATDHRASGPLDEDDERSGEAALNGFATVSSAFVSILFCILFTTFWSAVQFLRISHHYFSQDKSISFSNSSKRKPWAKVNLIPPQPPPTDSNIFPNEDPSPLLFKMATVVKRECLHRQSNDVIAIALLIKRNAKTYRRLSLWIPALPRHILPLSSMSATAVFRHSTVAVRIPP